VSIFLLTILSIILILTTGWLVYGLPGLLVFTSTIIGWCKDLFFQCLGYLSIVKVFFIWAGVVTVGGGLLYALTKGVWGVIRAHRAIRNLPKVDYGLDIVLIKDDLLQLAFTHGLFRPRVYISSGLIHHLTRSELNGVILHELYHKRHRDPLRFFLLSLLRDTFFYIPIGYYLLRLLHSLRERAADDAAVSKMDEPVGLASALVKIARFGNKMAIEPASIRGLGSVEGRIKRLVEGRDDSIKPPGLNTILSSLIVSGILSVSLALPIFAPASVYNPGMCGAGHCSIHADKMGEGCRIHCNSP